MHRLGAFAAAPYGKCRTLPRRVQQREHHIEHVPRETWLVLWRRRTGRGPLEWPLAVLLCGAAVALVVTAMTG
ncbi:hypothetical protein [Streptomyces sp. NBC_01465]|uniref:hypothetical protein n=1 Tax=Streptomyces sp. NBC_01465 TaxID=2903878 RepID=UPI002E37E09C|nr:hypothetical protein [Streptomyces sp. NBC_01465]